MHCGEKMRIPAGSVHGAPKSSSHIQSTQKLLGATGRLPAHPFHCCTQMLFLLGNGANPRCLPNAVTMLPLARAGKIVDVQMHALVIKHTPKKDSLRARAREEKDRSKCG